MSAIAHFSTVETTAQNRTGATTYALVSANTDIPSTEFVVGGKYLLLVWNHLRHSNTNGQGRCAVFHGSTMFADSEHSIEPAGGSVRSDYFWFDVWTAVTGEAIELRHATDGAGDTTTSDQCVLIAIRLDVDLVEGTDWDIANRTTDDTLTTTPTDGASLTWTPGVADNLWLLLNFAQIDPSSITVSAITEADLDGAQYGRLENEGEDATSDIWVLGFGRAVTLSAASHTFKERAFTSSGNQTRLHSRVFRLNLSKFKDADQAYTAGVLDGTVSSFGDAVQTLSHTVTVTSDTVVMAFASFVAIATGVGDTYRLQVTNTDQPATQTTDAYDHNGTVADARDDTLMGIGALVNLTGTATIDFDADVSAATAGRGYQYRSIIAFSMELAPAAQAKAPDPVVLYQHAQQHGGSW